MPRSNHRWLPPYCDPGAFLPRVQESRALFSQPPYLFADFAARALGFLQGDEARAMGFRYDPARALPCKWKCADESLFGVDLALYAATGQYPFDKGLIGGRFNEGALGAAVHHAAINVDFGGAHVGYMPDDAGGSFGHIARPLHGDRSTDCGYMMGLLRPFKEVYDDACANLLAYQPAGEDRILVSVPNEFLHPSWSSHRVKLLVDTETLTAGSVAFDAGLPHTRTPIGRTLFVHKPGLLDHLPPEAAAGFRTPTPTPIGRHLTHPFFHIFDSQAELDEHGMPVEKLQLYLKYILSARSAPYPLKAAIVNTNLEYNRLTDAVRADAFRPYAFASFTGVFIDLYDEVLGCYVNLFEPVGLSIKPAGTNEMVELLPGQIHEVIARATPATPVHPFAQVLGYDVDARDRLVGRFQFSP